jgi:hypothetical protein
MKTKTRGIAMIKVLAVLVMLPMLAACTQNRESSAGPPEINNGGKTMPAETQAYQTVATLPAIDTQTPAEFETATFGLG